MNDQHQPRARGRGRGRSRGNWSVNFSQSNDADQMMVDGESSREHRGRGRGRGHRSGQNHFQGDTRSRDVPIDKEKLKSNPSYPLMEGFLSRRYDASTKLLNLSTIASDQEILHSGMFASEGAQKKFFPALMIVCDAILETQEAKEQAVHSVTLAGNNLENTHAVYQLCNHFRHIQNLDLHNNAFATLDALKPWKGRFRNVEHLIIDPFPSINWEDEIISWFPKLKILNGNQVRPSAAANNSHTNAQQIPLSVTPTPPPAPIDSEQQKKEEMIFYVQRETNLTRDYAIQCLEAGQWNLDQAGALFAQSRDTLPAEAYN
ncbi:mrna export factor mex67 [Pyrenophora seminiperda CCB06]|uniref:Mrna export factor mex67 n=1 Tax=Pyrenophora seminiperda CCB06 TaxID=1302712 RepID=A0A3M7LWG2_9PLEO|nr:mrna export factor mex67 [Pyrenophora seminiperda CCB06]